MESQFKSNPNFRNVYVKGEVSDMFISAYGHLYFNLKDKKSQVPCIVYKWFRRNLQFDIEDGMKLLVIANVVVYAPHGKYQLDVRSATEDGLGQLYVKYQQLKKKLEKEGLFDDKHKKDLPHFVKRIGVITSKGGSVIHDIVKTVNENWPFCQVFLFPAAVQGENSKTELVTQIAKADDSDMDVLIVARGGGSIQDLWSYNEESVARAIFNAETPIISAIGHEDNITLADLVADKRASTPTMAASLTQVSASVSALNTAYADINGGIVSLSGKFGEVATAVASIQSGASSLATGASQVSTGLNTLNNSTSTLANGISQLSTGASSLNNGTSQLVTGAQSLSSGVSEVNDGAQALATGAASLSSGANDLANGTAQLADGVGALLDGAGRLEEGLNEFNDQAVDRLTDLINNLVPVSDRIEALKEYSTSYESFSGTPSGVNMTARSASFCGTIFTALCTASQVFPVRAKLNPNGLITTVSPALQKVSSCSNPPTTIWNCFDCSNFLSSSISVKNGTIFAPSFLSRAGTVI